MRKIILLIAVGLVLAGPAEKIENLRFPDAERQVVKSIFPDVLREFQIAEKSGQNIKEALERPYLDLFYDTDHFRIHYNLSGTHRCTETFATRTGEIAEYVWNVEVETMGFIPPPEDGDLGGNEKYDIYIRNLAYYYGSTMPENRGPESWDDYISYIEVENDFDGFPPTYDPEGSPWGELKVTLAHEFFHAIQLAYNGAAPDIWILEIGAVWMEEQVYPEPNDYLSYIDDYYGYPHIGLTIETMHCYASAPFFHYINNIYGFGAIKEVFEYARYTNNYISCLNDMLDERGTTLKIAFGDFSYWNWFTGDRSVSEYYGEEGGLWPEVYVERRVTAYPFTGSMSNKPNYLASNFIKFANIHPTADNMKIALDGSSTTDWQTRAVVYRSGGDIEIEGNGMDIDGDLITYIMDAASIDSVVFIPSAVRGGINQDWITYNYSVTAEFTDESGISEKSIPTELGVRFMPNPFNAQCLVDFGQPLFDAVFELYTADGRKAGQFNVPEGDHSMVIDGAGLESGVYLYRVSNGKVAASGTIALVK